MLHNLLTFLALSFNEVSKERQESEKIPMFFIDKCWLMILILYILSWGEGGHTLSSWKWVKEGDYYDRSAIFTSSCGSLFWFLPISFWKWSAHNLRWEVVILFYIDPIMQLIYLLFAWPGIQWSTCESLFPQTLQLIDLIAC